MKTTTLFQSVLLAAGLLLGGTSVVRADSAYTIIPRGGDLHSHVSDYHSWRHASGGHGAHRRPVGYHHVQRGKLCGKHHNGPHGFHKPGDRHQHGGHWQQVTHDDRHHDRHHGGHRS